MRNEDWYETLSTLLRKKDIEHQNNARTKTRMVATKKPRFEFETVERIAFFYIYFGREQMKL